MTRNRRESGSSVRIADERKPLRRQALRETIIAAITQSLIRRSPLRSRPWPPLKDQLRASLIGNRSICWQGDLKLLVRWDSVTDSVSDGMKLIDRVFTINWNRVRDDKNAEVWDRLTGTFWLRRSPAVPTTPRP